MKKNDNYDRLTGKWDSDYEEYQEGYKDFDSGKKEEDNPFPFDNQNWWRYELWEKGRKEAEDDDDYDWD